MRPVMMALVAGAIGFAGPAAAATLSVHNVSSGYDIHHLYISHYTQEAWGPDQLGDASEDVILPGETFRLKGIEPGTYDIKIVDDEGVECVIQDVDFLRTPVLAFDGVACAAEE